MERDPHDMLETGDEDLFGDPDEIEVSIEEELDERLQAEQDDDQ